MQAECEGKLFGHEYAGGVCLKCRGFQQSLRGQDKIERKWKENKSSSARAFLISQFLEKINKSRDGIKFKKLTPQALGYKLAHINLEDLRWLWDFCHRGDPKKFESKIFWWKLKN